MDTLLQDEREWRAVGHMELTQEEIQLYNGLDALLTIFIYGTFLKGKRLPEERTLYHICRSVLGEHELAFAYQTNHHSNIKSWLAGYNYAKENASGT